MPIYEYECNICHHQFEEVQKMTDPVITLCPECQQDTAVRLISAAGFQLKGSGWYVTDFKDKGKKPASSESTAKTACTTENKGGDK